MTSVAAGSVVVSEAVDERLAARSRSTARASITYNAMQNGWQEHPPQARRLAKPPIEGWTQLHFEYSAFVVLRQLSSPTEPA